MGAASAMVFSGKKYYIIEFVWTVTTDSDIDNNKHNLSHH